MREGVIAQGLDPMSKTRGDQHRREERSSANGPACGEQNTGMKGKNTHSNGNIRPLRRVDKLRIAH